MRGSIRKESDGTSGADGAAVSTSRPSLALFALLGTVLALVHLAAQALHAQGTADLTQVLLMPALAAVLWTATRAPRPRLVRLALLALALSWAGDTLPRFVDGQAQFLAMLGSFLLAQLVYALAFLPRWRRSVLTRPPRMLPYVAAVVVIVGLCAPAASALLPAVIVYALAICAMAVLATGLGRLGAVGGAVFVVSDALIALNTFEVLALPAHSVWVMATYIAAQVLLVLAVIRDAERPAAPR